jgi:hypothetical protein
MGVLFQIVFGLQTVWFLMALGGSFSAYKKFIPEGNGRAARLALWCASIGDTMLCVVYAVGVVTGGGLLNIVLLALWGYMSYRDISMLARIS